MEALVAVGLASNVVQFVQFASKLISEAYHIKNSGTPSSIHDLRKVSDSIVAQAETIHNSLKSTSAVLTQEEQVSR